MELRRCDPLLEQPRGPSRWLTPMRITSSRGRGATTYRIHRCGGNFRLEVQKLIPLFLRARANVRIGGTDDAPCLVVTLESLDHELEEEFLLTAGRFLVAA